MDKKGIAKKMCEMISVIIPAYNVENYIERSVRSVLSQSYTDIEIILVDDGSIDGTPNIIRELEKEDRRIRLIQKKNGGLSSARNAGIDAAKGRWIIFLDSDDYLEEDCVDTLYRTVKKNDVRFAMAGYYICNGNKKKIEHTKEAVIRDRYELHKYFLTDGAGKNFAWAKIYDRSVFDGLRYTEGHVYEDILIIHNILEAAGSCAIVDIPVYDYCLRDGSITYSPDIGLQYQGVEACLERVDFYNKHYRDLSRYVYAGTADFCFYLMGRITREGREDHREYWEKTLEVARMSSGEAFSVGVIYRVMCILLKICPGLMGRVFQMFSYLKNGV